MEESSITCAKFINADIALVICAPERGAVSPNFPHLLSPDQQGDSSCLQTVRRFVIGFMKQHIVQLPLYRPSLGIGISRSVGNIRTAR